MKTSFFHIKLKSHKRNTTGDFKNIPYRKSYNVEVIFASFFYR